MSPISLVSTVIIARHLVLMAKAMVAVSLASSLLLLLVVGGAVGLGKRWIPRSRHTPDCSELGAHHHELAAQ